MYFYLQDQLNASRIKLSELEAHAQEREVVIVELTSQIEHHRDKSENLVLQLSELAAEKQRLIESGRSQQDGLARQVSIKFIIHHAARKQRYNGHIEDSVKILKLSKYLKYCEINTLFLQ